MNIEYTVLSYRVMWRRNEETEWAYEDFSTEEEAFELFYELSIELFETKMIKIQAVESWY